MQQAASTVHSNIKTSWNHGGCMDMENRNRSPPNLKERGCLLCWKLGNRGSRRERPWWSPHRFAQGVSEGHHYSFPGTDAPFCWRNYLLSPPTYPQEDSSSHPHALTHHTTCEWKGELRPGLLKGPNWSVPLLLRYNVSNPARGQS